MPLGTACGGRTRRDGRCSVSPSARIGVGGRFRKIVLSERRATAGRDAMRSRGCGLYRRVCLILVREHGAMVRSGSVGSPGRRGWGRRDGRGRPMP